MGGDWKSCIHVKGWIPLVLLLCCDWIIVLSQGAKVPDFVNFQFTTEPVDTIAYKGGSLNLNCVVTFSGNPRPSIQWKKNGEILNLSQERRYRLASNGSLLISDVSDKKLETDEGDYQCMASVAGEIIWSRKATVNVAGIGRNFDIEPQDLEVFSTETAIFQCSIKSIPGANISWFKDNNEEISDKANKYRTYREGVLEIYDVAFSDFGKYYCLAEGVDKSRKSREATLSQKNAEANFQGIDPDFSLRPRDMSAMVGSKVILFCGAYGLGSTMERPKISWLKDGRTIDLNKDGRVTMKEGGNLQILNVKSATPTDTATDEAMYMCRAENDIDSVDAEAKLTVLVPPKFTVLPVNTNANKTSDLTLNCQVEGQPKPKISWLKNGVKIVSSDYFDIIEDRSLRILGLIESDSGYYQCFAENLVGNIQATIQLNVVKQTDLHLPMSPSTPSIYYHVHRSGAYGAANPNDVPSQPTNVKTMVVTTRNVSLSWGVPDRTGASEILAYSIRWRETGSERERATTVNAQEVNIQQLKPNTNYEFKVSAFNRYGLNMIPASLTVKTHQEDDVPTEAQHVIATPLSTTSIEVTWDSPLQTKGNILTYQLYYYPLDTKEETEITHTDTTLSHVIDGLEEFVEYGFRIVAVNANGPGTSATETTARTFSDKPSDVPQNFTLVTSSSTSIVVRWQPVKQEHQNGHLTGYKIRYKKKSGDKKGSTVTTAGDRTLYALTDLKKDTQYQVRISAQTVNGSGPPTDWQFEKTYKDDLDESQVPDMPDKLVVRPTTNSLIVQWVPNQRSKYLVRGYLLGYGKGIPDVFKQTFDANTFYYTIENLQPASEFVVSIRAFNEKGPGHPRYDTVFTLEKTVEEPVTPMLPPIGLKAVVLSPHTIVITWTDNSLGQIQRIIDNRYYTVKYNSIPSRGKTKMLNSTDLNCHIEDLKPDTLYEFYVKVTKGRRKSTWSMAVTNKTQESAPGSMPRDLTTVPVEGDPLSVTLNWQPPQKPNGQITGYLVFYTTDPEQDDLDWVVEGVIGERLSMTITDLTEDTIYYFKVQARNSKGYGPMSSTKYYTTPKGGRIDRVYDRNGKPVKLPGDYPDEGNTSRDKEEKGGLSQNVMIIIIACVVGATFCIVVAVVTVILCRKRDVAERNRRLANMYKNSPQKGKSAKPPGPNIDGQPPDLWIDHDHLELKHLGKDQRAESSISVASTRRNSHDSSSIHTNNQAEIYMSGSEAEERLLPPAYHQLQQQQQQQQQQQRNIIRPKPIKIPQESIATAYPNGHLGQRYTPTPGNCPPSPSEDSGVVAMRPVYPRTQYQMQYGTQGPPRVNAGDIGNTSMHAGYPMEYGYRLVPCLEEDDNHGPPEAYDDSYMNRVGYGGFSTPSHHGSLSRRGKTHRAPITGIASPVVPVKLPEGPNSGNTGSLGRSGNPLRSFSVPDPPGFHKKPGTNTSTPKHIVKPQQSTTPYKKQTTPISSGPIKPHAMMAPMMSPKSAPDVLKTAIEDTTDIPVKNKSLSTEELTAEMANLEGLMKDLNAITQQDFQC